VQLFAPHSRPPIAWNLYLVVPASTGGYPPFPCKKTSTYSPKDPTLEKKLNFPPSQLSSLFWCFAPPSIFSSAGHGEPPPSLGTSEASLLSEPNQRSPPFLKFSSCRLMQETYLDLSSCGRCVPPRERRNVRSRYPVIFFKTFLPDFFLLDIISPPCLILFYSSSPAVSDPLREYPRDHNAVILFQFR